MGMRALESAILSELRDVMKSNTVKSRDIMEWRTGKDSIEKQEGETLFYLPHLQVTCSVKLPDKKTRKNAK